MRIKPDPLPFLRHLIFSFFLLLPVTAKAATEPSWRDLMQTRNLGMGGAFRALGAGGESAFGNPATLALSRRYQVDMTAGYDPATSFGWANTAVADGTNLLAAGVSYHFVNLGQGETQRTAHINTLAFAFPLFGTLTLGVSGKHVLMNGALERNGVTLDAGAALKLFEIFTLALSAHNLIDIKNPDMTRYFALGAALKLGPVIATSDVRSDFFSLDGPMAYGVGLEFAGLQGLPLRIGYSRNTTEFVSAGFSLEEGANAIDFGYRHELGGLNSRLIGLTVRITAQ